MQIVSNENGKIRIRHSDGSFVTTFYESYLSGYWAPLEFKTLQEAKDWLFEYEKENVWLAVK